MERFIRTVMCGQVTQAHVGTTVTVCGWVDRRRDHGNVMFIDLRDRSGIVQVVCSPAFSPEAHEAADALRSEYVVSVTGVVVDRAPGTVNSTMATGAYEIHAKNVVIHSAAKALPFQIDSVEDIDEELRLTYRYLDLRRPGMQAHLALRHAIIHAIRTYMHDETFYEIETPILTKNTPEGAREFIVPSRIKPGMIYSLPQSPQLYKQLLMAGGMERYFQIARCFRDEDLRADRQPEFTQLDVEMSFVNQHDVQDLIERLMKRLYKQFLGIELSLPLARMTYKQAFEEYGSDKPDIRFGLKVLDITRVFHDTQVGFLQSVLTTGGKIGALHVPHRTFTRSELDHWVETAVRNGAKGLLWIRVAEGGKLESPIAKFLPADAYERFAQHIPDFGVGSTLFIMAGACKDAWTQLGRLRLQLADALGMIPHDVHSLHWVIDFPLLELDPESGQWSSVHHPFTRPHDGWESQQPGDITAQAYDLVMNGVELGGGSIRIHERWLQEKIFDFLGLDRERMHAKFGFLLEAQEYGFPPHGGIALGIDRMIMLFARCTSIREVIAFPKTARGMDAMMQAPTPVDQKQLREYGLQLRAKDLT